MPTIKLKIVTPEKTVYEDEIDQITLPTSSGEITVLPNHLALVSSLRPGEILIKKGGEEIPLATAGGFIEVAENSLTILADSAERPEEIDEAEAEEARQKAEELMKKRGEKTAEAIDYAGLTAKIERELARLKVARKYRKLKPPIKWWVMILSNAFSNQNSKFYF